MKSIIEEASSIIKAIEKGWASAGKPTEFTVKILEQPAYNFLGFNTKPAKISFFFDDRTITASIEKQSRGESKKPDFAKAVPSTVNANRRDNKQQAKPVSRREEPHVREEQKPRHATENKAQERGVQSKKPERTPQVQQSKELKSGSTASIWNQETVNMARDWVQDFLYAIQKNNIKFTTNAQNHILKIDFSASITSNNQKELMLFKNAAHLLMSSLRNVTSSELKQLKVVFSTTQA